MSQFRGVNNLQCCAISLAQVVGSSSSSVKWPKFTLEKSDPILGDFLLVSHNKRQTNKCDIYHRFLGEVYAGKTNLSPELTLVSFITFSCITATLSDLDRLLIYNDSVSWSRLSSSPPRQPITELPVNRWPHLKRSYSRFESPFHFCCTSQSQGVSQQCDASQRRSLVHGQEEVLHERAHGSATSPFPPQEVPREVQAAGQEGGLLRLSFVVPIFKPRWSS